MHCLEVIIAKNRDAAARECAHATLEGNIAKADRIIDAEPRSWIESEFHKEFRRVIQEEC